jgi:hypothetical protein
MCTLISPISFNKSSNIIKKGKKSSEQSCWHNLISIWKNGKVTSITIYKNEFEKLPSLTITERWHGWFPLMYHPLLFSYKSQDRPLSLPISNRYYELPGYELNPRSYSYVTKESWDWVRIRPQFSSGRPSRDQMNMLGVPETQERRDILIISWCACRLYLGRVVIIEPWWKDPA